MRIEFLIENHCQSPHEWYIIINIDAPYIFVLRTINIEGLPHTQYLQAKANNYHLYICIELSYNKPGHFLSND